MMEVMVRVGVTLNLGNYESMRVDVESGAEVIGKGVTTKKAHTIDASEAIDEHYELLEEKLLEKAAELYARLVQEGLIKASR